MAKRLALLAALLVAPLRGAEPAPLPEAPAVALHVLSTVRGELAASRARYKALSADERSVIKKARGTVEEGKKWSALAPSFGAAADLLERASRMAEQDEDLLRSMSKTYRAMATEIDKGESYLTEELKEKDPAERADATLAAAEKLLEEAKGEDAEVETLAWERVQRLDPRTHALAANLKTLARGYATLLGRKHGEEAAKAIAKAEKLHEATAPCFKGVPMPLEGEPATPEGPDRPGRDKRIRDRERY